MQRELITFQIDPNDSKAGGGSCFPTGSYQQDDTPYSRAFLSTFIG